MQPFLGQTMMALAGQIGGDPRKQDEVPFLPLAERAPGRSTLRGAAGKKTHAGCDSYVLYAPLGNHTHEPARLQGLSWALLFSLRRTYAA
jgi:hypothetical protein